MNVTVFLEFQQSQYYYLDDIHCIFIGSVQVNFKTKTNKKVQSIVSDS